MRGFFPNGGNQRLWQLRQMMGPIRYSTLTCPSRSCRFPLSPNGPFSPLPCTTCESPSLSLFFYVRGGPVQREKKVTAKVTKFHGAPVGLLASSRVSVVNELAARRFFFVLFCFIPSTFWALPFFFPEEKKNCFCCQTIGVKDIPSRRSPPYITRGGPPMRFFCNGSNDFAIRIYICPPPRSVHVIQSLVTVNLVGSCQSS